MAKYKSLKGQPIQVLTADPPAPVEGQVWVVANPGTASVMKGYRLGAGTWATGGNLNTGRKHITLAGTQTAAIVAGGYITSTDAVSALSEEYDGSSWAEGNDLNTARQKLAGIGTQTAGLACGGFSPAAPNAAV